MNYVIWDLEFLDEQRKLGSRRTWCPASKDGKHWGVAPYGHAVGSYPYSKSAARQRALEIMGPVDGQA